MDGSGFGVFLLPSCLLTPFLWGVSVLNFFASEAIFDEPFSDGRFWPGFSWTSSVSLSSSSSSSSSSSGESAGGSLASDAQLAALREKLAGNA